MTLLDYFLRKYNRLLFYLFSALLISYPQAVLSQPTKQPIQALYIPLADHYAALVAYERYRNEMKYADFHVKKMKNWDYLRAYFHSGTYDMAFVMSPLAMDMYHEKPHFRWIGLMHRDGNALAINELLNKKVNVAKDRKDRKPDKAVATALGNLYKKSDQSTEIGMPHLLSTHTVVLYRYLKENNIRMSLLPNEDTEVLAISVAPPKSPSFLKAKNNRVLPAAFEQSLPWADIVETGGFGKVAWYSKDVMPWKNGHVECIALATNKAIKNKTKAVKEVMSYIRKAGNDIEIARKEGGRKLEQIVKIVRKHIKAHTRKAIIASLNPELRVINYENLNIDEAGLKLIMDYAVDGKILKYEININEFADHQFDSEE